MRSCAQSKPPSPCSTTSTLTARNVSQVDVVKMLCGAIEPLANNTFRRALNDLIPFVHEWDKLDTSETGFKKFHKLDQLERIHKQLVRRRPLVSSSLPPSPEDAR